MNLSKIMLYQSYLTLINVIIVVDVDVTLSQVKYLYEISNVKGTRAERSDNWSMHVVFRVYPCHLRCLVM